MKIIPFLLFPIFAFAQGMGTVISVTPVVDNVYQQQSSCQTNPVGNILGIIGGAAIGSQIGQGNGRVIGAATGAVLGGQYSGQNCQVYSVPTTIVRGYNVVYDYNGGRYSQFMTYQPGTHVQVMIQAR